MHPEPVDETDGSRMVTGGLVFVLSASRYNSCNLYFRFVLLISRVD
jgi:hypothetical protein